MGAYRAPAIRQRVPNESRRRIALNASAAMCGSHAIASANNLLVSIIAFSSRAPCHRQFRSSSASGLHDDDGRQTGERNQNAGEHETGRRPGITVDFRDAARF